MKVEELIRKNLDMIKKISKDLPIFIDGINFNEIDLNQLYLFLLCYDKETAILSLSRRQKNPAFFSEKLFYNNLIQLKLINFYDLYITNNLSEKFIEDFKHYIKNWRLLTNKQNVSEEFLKRNKQKIIKGIIDSHLQFSTHKNEMYYKLKKLFNNEI